MVGTVTVVSNHTLLNNKFEVSGFGISTHRLEETVFRIFPRAEIFGIYVFFYLEGISKKCPEMNVWIPDRRDRQKLKDLRKEIKDVNILSLKMRELFEHEEAHFILLGDKNVPWIRLNLSFGEPINKVHWTSNCLSMNNDRKINLFCEVSGKREEFLKLINQDIRQKKMRWIGDFGKHETQYEIRICYLKLVRDFISILERFRDWELVSPLKIRLYDFNGKKVTNRSMGTDETDGASEAEVADGASEAEVADGASEAEVADGASGNGEVVDRAWVEVGADGIEDAKGSVDGGESKDDRGDHGCGEDCGICYERADRFGVHYGIQLDCSHVFHLDCLSENMMELNPTADLCPVCRRQILTYDYIRKEFVSSID